MHAGRFRGPRQHSGEASRGAIRDQQEGSQRGCISPVACSVRHVCVPRQFVSCDPVTLAVSCAQTVPSNTASLRNWLRSQVVVLSRGFLSSRPFCIAKAGNHRHELLIRCIAGAGQQVLCAAHSGPQKLSWISDDNITMRFSALAGWLPEFVW